MLLDLRSMVEGEPAVVLAVGGGRILFTIKPRRRPDDVIPVYAARGLGAASLAALLAAEEDAP